MKHAGPATFERLTPLLAELRIVPGLVETRPGVFYRRGRAFLHFHDDPTGAHADVRVSDDFERHRVESPEEQRALLALVRGV